MRPDLDLPVRMLVMRNGVAKVLCGESGRPLHRNCSRFPTCPPNRTGACPQLMAALLASHSSLPFFNQTAGVTECCANGTSDILTCHLIHTVWMFTNSLIPKPETSLP